jgi:hypothetical protein
MHEGLGRPQRAAKPRRFGVGVQGGVATRREEDASEYSKRMTRSLQAAMSEPRREPRWVGKNLDRKCADRRSSTHTRVSFLTEPSFVCMPYELSAWGFLTCNHEQPESRQPLACHVAFLSVWI